MNKHIDRKKSTQFDLVRNFRVNSNIIPEELITRSPFDPIPCSKVTHSFRMLVGLGHFADVAQTVEQVPCKHQVAGSIPVVGYGSISVCSNT